jgi:hypothetical protein
MGSYIWIINGLLFWISIFFKNYIGFLLPIGFLIIGTIYLFLYSYLIFKQQTAHKE